MGYNDMGEKHDLIQIKYQPKRNSGTYAQDKAQYFENNHGLIAFFQTQPDFIMKPEAGHCRTCVSSTVIDAPLFIQRTL